MDGTPLPVRKKIKDIHHAILKCNLTDTLTFIGNGCDVNMTDNNGDTPLIQACFKGSLDIVTFLIENGAKVNKKGNNGMTPLIMAASWGHYALVVKLIEHGALVNVVDCEGQTALHCATENDEVDIVSCLLKSEAKIDVFDKEGMTPLDLAIRNDSRNIINLFNVYEIVNDRCKKLRERIVHLESQNSLVQKNLDDLKNFVNNIDHRFETRVAKQQDDFERILAGWKRHSSSMNTTTPSSNSKSTLKIDESLPHEVDQKKLMDTLLIFNIEERLQENLFSIVKSISEILGFALFQNDVSYITRKSDPRYPNQTSHIEVQFSHSRKAQMFLSFYKRMSRIKDIKLKTIENQSTETVRICQKFNEFYRDLHHRVQRFALSRGYKKYRFENGTFFLQQNDGTEVLRIRKPSDLPQ